MSETKTVIINGAKCEIGRELSFRSDGADTKHMKQYRFFETRDPNSFVSKIAANYGDYWAIGENFYDASDRLESKMFAAYRGQFMSIINKQKTKGK